jgi:oxygen-independent coproporphyrinogen-3 oxidase
LTQIKVATGAHRHAGGMDVASLIEKYDARVPRYTSYPTAPHFSPAVDAGVYRGWLAALADDDVLSLYVHVPFCARLCWYCACHTTAVNRPEPVQSYADTVLAEIDLVAAAIGRRLPVRHVHWGGGSPTVMPPRRLREIMDRLRTRFAFDAKAEIAVEIDPRTVNAAVIDGLVDMGCNRASLGVQDFDPLVQQAVNRIQSWEATRACAEALRGRGIRSINVDLMYGLPYQTAAGMAETAGRALDLAPDRVAVFGYAHVPWMKKHQLLMPEAALAGAMERWAQLQAAEREITARGYCTIGLDHYALPTDDLSIALHGQSLRRNFQGYTTDTAPVLLGLGASSIGSLAEGYVQNAAAVAEWRDTVRAGELPTKRGIALTADDRLRREVIEQLMCQGRVSLTGVAGRHAADPEVLRAAAPRLRAMARDGVLDFDGDMLAIRPEARPFVRTVAAVFDSYLEAHQARHARTV